MNDARQLWLPVWPELDWKPAPSSWRGLVAGVERQWIRRALEETLLRRSD